jgi:hypothetical protein
MNAPTTMRQLHQHSRTTPRGGLALRYARDLRPLAAVPLAGPGTSLHRPLRATPRVGKGPLVTGAEAAGGGWSEVKRSRAVFRTASHERNPPLRRRSLSTSPPHGTHRAGMAGGGRRER